MGQYILHKAETRGRARLGWLDSHHTFSFSEYYDPSRMRFGLLRVLNDDVVAGGMGFGTHPHDNMEIISIPLYGDLEHKDSMGNTSVIRQGDVQLMSAGTGIQHSEFNHHPEQAVNFLQIWIFPEKRNIPPRYDQRSFPVEGRQDRLQLLVAPLESDADAVKINQQAWLYMTRPGQGSEITYVKHNPQNGVYLFLTDGIVEVNGHAMERRDGMGITGEDQLNIRAGSQAELLIIEVPMDLPVLK